MDALPHELLEKIFKCLTASGLAQFERVCLSWKQKVDELGAWKTLFKRDFPWAHQGLAALHQTRLNQNPGTIAWSRAYRAYSLGQEPWHEEFCLKGHTFSISCITAFSDGRLATGSLDRTVRIWSPEGEELHVLRGHTNGLRCITALSDGCLATTPSDETVHIWSPEGEELHVIRGHTSWIPCITALSDGRLATVSLDGTVRIWSPEGEELRVLHRNVDGIGCITILPDGRLAQGYIDNTVPQSILSSEVSEPHSATMRIWSLEGEELCVLRGHTDLISCIIALPDGRLATGSRDSTVRIWSSEGKELHVLRGHTDTIRCLTALPDGRLATGSYDRTVRIWSSEGKELLVLHGHASQIQCITALPDGRLATGANDCTARIWSPDLHALHDASLKVDDHFDTFIQSTDYSALPGHKVQSDIEYDVAEKPNEESESDSILGKRKGVP